MAELAKALRVASIVWDCSDCRHEGCLGLGESLHPPQGVAEIVVSVMRSGPHTYRPRQRCGRLGVARLRGEDICEPIMQVSERGCQAQPALVFACGRFQVAEIGKSVTKVVVRHRHVSNVACAQCCAVATDRLLRATASRQRIGKLKVGVAELWRNVDRRAQTALHARHVAGQMRMLSVAPQALQARRHGRTFNTVPMFR